MKRLYFLAADLVSTEAIAKDIHKAGITDYNFHVLGKDEQGLKQHRIHQASPLIRLDILHSGEIGALAGLVVGFFTAGIFMKSMEGLADFGLWQFFAVMLFVTMFGTWVGGIAGVSHENYKLSGFHNDIELGKFLVMVDVDKRLEKVVDGIMANHTSVVKEGYGDRWDNPFEGLPMMSDEHHR